MLTTAITAGISAALAYFGIDPTMYVAPIWVSVKVTIVGSIAGLMWWRQKKSPEKKASTAETARLEP